MLRSDPSIRNVQLRRRVPFYKAKGLQDGGGDRIIAAWHRFVYTYAYGDNWRHDVIVEEVRDGDPDRELIRPSSTGRGAVRTGRLFGGPDGFMDFLEAVFNSAHDFNIGTWSDGTVARSIKLVFDKERARFCTESAFRH